LKVIIANNSAILRQILGDLLRENGDQVLLQTASGRESADAALGAKIDLLVLGENLSGLSEDEILRLITEKNPCPVILIGNPEADANRILLQHGLLRIIPKPSIEELQEKSYQQKLLAELNQAVSARPHAPDLSGRIKSIIKNAPEPKSAAGIEHVVIGSSTGGPNALKAILEKLPADFPAAISVVQHMKEGQEANLASWLDKCSSLHVRLAVNNDQPVPGEVIMAAQGRHLIVKNRIFYYIDGPKVNFQIPAVDRLFTSAAAEYGARLAGVLLTGMGSDGAKGCAEILKNGGITIVQDEQTSTVFGMPKAAIEISAASRVLPLDAIAGYLMDIIKRGSRD